MTRQTLVFRYMAFAALATIANLAAQRVILAFDGSGFGYVTAVCFGTAIGLAIKYALDKKWIFYDSSSGLKKHTRMFSLYSVMGVFTTLIFWSFETAFWLIWRTNEMREIGAILGLTIGYTIKYNLDRRYVFTTARS